MTENTNTTPAPLQHFYAGDIQAAKVTDTPRGGNNGTGYGPKIPTRYMLQTRGPGPKWLRVYVVNYGNTGSAYVTRGGVDYYLSPGAELILETIRDGGTLESARAAMAVWPEWMQESEHLQVTPVPPAPAPEVPAVDENTRFTVTTYYPTQLGSRAANQDIVTGLKWDGVQSRLDMAGVTGKTPSLAARPNGFIFKAGANLCRVTVQDINTEQGAIDAHTAATTAPAPFRVGDYITHPLYGAGLVVEVTTGGPVVQLDLGVTAVFPREGWR